VRAGQRRHKVRLEVPVQVKNKYNEMVTTWNLFASPYVSIETLKGFERAASNANWPGAEVKICMRYIAGVLPTMRVVHGTQVYSIVGKPNNLEGRNREIELTCSTGVII